MSATMHDVDLTAAQEAAVRAIDDAEDDLIALSKFIHDNPEIALEEVRSSAACADFLEQRGFAVERGVAARNQACARVAWRFTVADARVTLAHVYPIPEPDTVALTHY